MVFRWSLIFWAMILVGTAPARPHVVIISVDGLRPDAIAQVKPPLLTKLIQEGAYSAKARTVIPANTLPAHASMLTGVSPKRHKMWHDDLDRTKGDIRYPSIFARLHEKGGTSAMFFAKDKFLHIATDGAPDVVQKGKDNSMVVMKLACAEIRKNRTDLVFIGLPDPDSYGHMKGWMGPEYLKSVQKNDDCLRLLLQTLRDTGILADTTIILSADHGGHNRVHGTKNELDMTIPWLAWGRGIRHGVKITTPVRTEDTAATALKLLGIPLPADLEGKVVAGVLE
jgi:predicted AlkP superfamily pyrophosphatase or phosphodiesterase